MSSKKSKNKSKPQGKPVLTPRNPLSQNPLMKKSHVHDKTEKTKRAKLKQELRKNLLDE